MKFLVLIGLLLNVAYAGEGSGSSGGGEIYFDRVNPWFLQNTTTVTYCVEISPDFSLLPKKEVTSQIKAAINHWKREFSEVKPNDYFLVPTPVVATQEFIQTECSLETDLRFQMGTLTAKQIQSITDIDKTIGIAFRESYDKVNMRAKGFIYLAPERGMLRPDSQILHDRPWSAKTTADGQHEVLYMALIHELGHVFGLRDDHSTVVGDNEVMGAGFVESITDFQQSWYSRKRLKSLRTKPALLGVIGSTLNHLPSEVKDFLGLPAEYMGMVMVDGEGNDIKIKIEEGEEVDRVVGTISIGSHPHKMANVLYKTRVKVWLPKEQQVFKLKEEDSYIDSSYYHRAYTTLSSYTLLDVEYRRADGSSSVIDLHFGNWMLQASALINGRYYHNLLFPIGGQD